jgi:hypothetical protein
VKPLDVECRIAEPAVDERRVEQWTHLSADPQLGPASGLNPGSKPG